MQRQTDLLCSLSYPAHFGPLLRGVAKFGFKMSEAGDEASEGSSGGPMPSLPPAPAAVREDQVQNAMAFLSHPKVKAL